MINQAPTSNNTIWRKIKKKKRLLGFRRPIFSTADRSFRKSSMIDCCGKNKDFFSLLFHVLKSNLTEGKTGFLKNSHLEGWDILEDNFSLRSFRRTMLRPNTCYSLCSAKYCIKAIFFIVSLMICSQHSRKLLVFCTNISSLTYIIKEKPRSHKQVEII